MRGQNKNLQDAILEQGKTMREAIETQSQAMQTQFQQTFRVAAAAVDRARGQPRANPGAR